MTKSKLRKVKVLGMGVSACTYDSAIEDIHRLIKDYRKGTVTASATHLIMEAYFDNKLRERINAFDVVTPDGVGALWGLNLLGKARLNNRVTGPDLTLMLCELAVKENLKLFFYGSTKETVEALRDALLEKYPGLQIAGVKPSWFRSTTEEEDQQDIDDINNSGAHICFVGLGCPRQENWTYEHKDSVNAVLFSVGAAFDFHAGTVSRAPAWMRDNGMEWVYRLYQEPRRLWWRYLIYNPLFLILLLLQWAGLIKFPDK